MKVIVIGISTTGKTTLVKYLRQHTKLRVSEIDEELTKLNHGKFPFDDNYRNEALGPQVVQKVLQSDNIIFFTNTDYFSINDLITAKNNGFKIIQLKLSTDDLKKRNAYRVKREGYEDHTHWFGGMLAYQEKIRNKKIVDKIINAHQLTKKIAEDLLTFLNVS